MWHEARKHEKKIRGIMNDFYKRRSERRKQFYDIVVSSDTFQSLST
jgi:splicing factor, arginine/serine-rich 16